MWDTPSLVGSTASSISRVRVAVVDIGSNSTRLLIADVATSGTVGEVLRRSRVTRLGDGVDSRGSLSDEAVDNWVHSTELLRLDLEDLARKANDTERYADALTSMVFGRADIAKIAKAPV